MPAKAKRALKKSAKKKGFGKERTAKYVYGTLQKIKKKQKKK